MHEDSLWEGNRRFVFGRGGSEGADVRTGNASPGHSKEAQDPRA